ncbi:MAG: collagenase [Neptunomonas phycophila]|uniref:collagenase n=1 Tax=Neptunomonas phycophila TaxID=1572645 RepID=UPI003B8CF82A
MKKLSTIAVAITAALSVNAYATNYHGHDGITHIDSKVASPTISRVQTSNTPQKYLSVQKFARSYSVAAKSANNNIVPDTCETNEFASYSGNDFVEYVSNAYLANDSMAGYDCFRSIFQAFDEDSVVFSADNYDNVATALLDELSSDDPIAERIFGKMMFLRGMYYNYIVHNGNFSIPDDESKVKQSFEKIFDVYGTIVLDDSNVHGALLSETIVLAGSYYGHKGETGTRAEQFSDILPTLKQILIDIQPLVTSPSEEGQYGLSLIANASINELNRMIRYYDGADVYQDNELPGILAQYIYNISIDDPVPSNAVYALLGMAQHGTTDPMITAVQEVLDATGKFSETHIALLRTITEFDLDCSAFGRDSLLCVTDELIVEMREFALPYEYTFGDIVIKTKMSEERTRHVYNSLQATRSQFFRDTGITEAVANDPNEQSTFVIYGSPDDYKTFHGYLYNLDTNNGGIYIEQDGTLYTFDRPDTDMFVLEELARHEYAHYLISRYLVNGMWGETDMYADNRMVWFDEGLANYLTGAQQSGDVEPLATMIEMKGWHSTRTISEITSTSYSDDWMYPFSALLFNYINYAGDDSLINLSAALAADDTSEFDSVVSSLSSMNGGFQSYIDGLTTEGWTAPWYEYRTDGQLEADNVTDIETVMTDAMGSTASCSEVDESNFKCSFTVDASGTKATQIDIVNSTLNVGITAALAAGQNNFETVTCHPTTFNGDTVDAECIGLLRPDHIAYDDGDTDPVDSDGDGYPDDEDAFPNDPTEWEDTDGDGVGNNGDVFPNDPNEWADSDEDGYGDNSDAFPNDPTEWADSDGDGTGDNADAFPNDATETTDTDGDGVGDNADVFPNDSTEWADSDGDGYGDNGDAFPNDSTEWVDTDGDGYGDNSDAYPNDATKWEQDTSTGGGTTTPVTQPATAEKSSGGGSFGFLSIFGTIALLWARRKGIDIEA